MYVSITELIWQAKPRGQTIQGKKNWGHGLFNEFLWGTRFLRHLLADPKASTGCQQSLEIG